MEEKMEEKSLIEEELSRLSDRIEHSTGEVSIILAAGHGKRIKSEKSKMLHEIWGKPTVWRVCEAALKGLSSENQVVVVGKKALEVARALGKRKNRVFIFQEEQRGTGDAVKTALEHEELSSFNGAVYVLPGDMGLLSEHTLTQFESNFRASNCDMLVLTGSFEGDTQDNYYGRILKSKINSNEIIEIKEYRDILALKDDEPYTLSFKGHEESFTKDELLATREFNTGVYAFRSSPLKKFIYSLTSNNVQGEIYITDLIKIFGTNGYKAGSSRVSNNNLVVAFNVKSVLKKMEDTFRSMLYEQLKDIVTIDDSEDFFIAEETVQRIIEMDKKFAALDIRIGKGAYIGDKVVVNRGLFVGRNAILKGTIQLGENVSLGENVMISTYPDQVVEIGDNSQILRGNIIKGMVKIKNSVRIESGVQITGSSEEPVVIGNNVVIKGMTYVFGSIIEDDILIEHSILKNKYVEKVVKKNGDVQPIKYILPHPEGLDSITPSGERK